MLSSNNPHRSTGSTLNTVATTLTSIATLGTAYYFYNKLTAVAEPRPFSNQPNDSENSDLKCYNDLCRYRRELGDIPEEWELKASAPQYYSSFHEKSDDIISVLDRINKSDFPQKSIVIGMIYDIRRMFNSMSKKWTKVNTALGLESKNYREDGFEAMFFTDFVRWLSIDLLNRDVKKKETEDSIAEWIQYCKKVQAHVLIYRTKQKKPSDPKYRLLSIIDSLERLKSNVSKSCKSSTFNDRIEQINRLFIDMTRDTFDLFFMLLNGVHNDHLLVKVLLAHDLGGDSNVELDEKFTKLASYAMCKWIVSTLKMAGIKDNDFELHQKIDMKFINEYLVTNTNDLSDLSQTGLWDFAKHKAYKIKMNPPPSLFPWENNVLYLTVDAGELHYAVLSPKNTAKKGTISLEALGLQHHQGSITLDVLNTKLNDILNITSKAHHTYKPTSNVEYYLNKILQLHRSLLMQFEVRRSIILASKVGTGWGQSWVYGADTCVEHIDNLLTVIPHSFNTFYAILTEFWDSIYRNDYELYNSSGSGLCYKKMHQADTIVSGFSSYKTQLDELISLLKTGENNPENKNEYIQHCLDQLDGNMTIYSQVTGLPLKPTPKNKAEKTKNGSEIASGIFIQNTGLLKQSHTPPSVVAGVSALSEQPLNLTLLPGNVSKIPPDDNCFFNAVSQECRRLGVNALTSMELRQHSVAYLKYNPELLEIGCPKDKKPDQYLIEMQNDATTGGARADHLIREIVARILNVELNIFEQKIINYDQYVLNIEPVNRGIGRPVIGLLLCNEHYDVVELGNAKLAKNTNDHSKGLVNNVISSETLEAKRINYKEVTLINTPTTIRIENKTYILFDVVSKLLNASQDELQASGLNLMLDNEIIARPKPFKSTVQQQIFNNFLMPNNTHFNLPWWMSFLGGIANNKYDKFKNLHQRVKAVMAVVYLSKDLTDQPITPSPLEIAMIDTILYNTVKKSFDDNQFYQYRPEWIDPPLELKKNVDSVEFTLDILKFRMTQDTIAQFSADLVKQSSEKDEQIAKLKKDNEVKDAELVTTKNELVTKENELVTKKNELVTTKNELLSLQKSFDDVQLQLQDYQKTVNNLELKFSDLCPNQTSNVYDFSKTQPQTTGAHTDHIASNPNTMFSNSKPTHGQTVAVDTMNKDITQQQLT